MNAPLDSIICLRPFYALELNLNGNVSVCCPAWSKKMVGNTRRQSLMEIWNGKPLQEMRSLMLEGRWTRICRASCPYIMDFRAANQMIHLPGLQQHVITDRILSAVRSRQTILETGPTWLNLSNSNACNLTCVMCGRDRYPDNRTHLRTEIEEVKSLLPGLRELFLTGNGDPFARQDTRELMLGLDPSKCPDLRINLLTNGLLLPRYWEQIRHLNFGELDISVDAATPATYETIRRGGRWKDLLAALDTVSRDRGRFSRIMINMTVMRDNYREIPAFVELAGNYGVGVAISQVRGKWGSQNIFTSGEAGVMRELRDLINQARQRAEELGIAFYCSGFNDLLAGQEMSPARRYQQIMMDNLVQLYYRLKR